MIKTKAVPHVTMARKGRLDGRLRCGAALLVAERSGAVAESGLGAVMGKMFPNATIAIIGAHCALFTSGCCATAVLAVSYPACATPV